MWTLEFPHFAASSLESPEIKKGGENILITVFPLKKLSTASTTVPKTWSVTLPPSLSACSKNASLSLCLSRCAWQHDGPSTSIHCTVMSITTFPQRKHIRRGCGRTVNSTIAVAFCIRYREWYWNYFTACRSSCVTVMNSSGFPVIKLFL